MSRKDSTHTLNFQMEDKLANLARSMKTIEKLKDEREPIVEKCLGCENIKEEATKEYKVGRPYDGSYCSSYAHPGAKWRVGVCPRATHIEKEIEKEKISKKRVGQQKQKKKRR